MKILKLTYSTHFLDKLFLVFASLNLVYFTLVLSSILNSNGSQIFLWALIFLLLIWLFHNLSAFNNNFVLFLSPFILNLLWWNYVDTKPVSDFLSIYLNASKFSSTFDFLYLQQSKSPIVTLYYSVFLYIFGNSTFVAVLAASTAWSLQAPIIRLILLSTGCSERNSLYCALLYCFTPALIFYSPVISYEGPSILIYLIAFFFGIKIYSVQKNIYFFMFGMFFSLSFIARLNSLLIVGPILILIFFYLKNKKFSRIKFYGSFTAGIIIPIFLQIALNYYYENRLSLTSNNLSTLFYSVLITGTNIEYSGTYNTLDIHNIPENMGVKEYFNLIINRIFYNPSEFYKMSIGSKLSSLWDGDGFSVFWSNFHIPPVQRDNIYFYYKLATIGMVTMIITVLFVSITFIYNFFNVYQKEVTIHTILLRSLLLSLTLLSILHIFIEVQGRYHLMAYPLIVLSLGSSLNYKFLDNLTKHTISK